MTSSGPSWPDPASQPTVSSGGDQGSYPGQHPGQHPGQQPAPGQYPPPGQQYPQHQYPPQHQPGQYPGHQQPGHEHPGQQQPGQYYPPQQGYHEPHDPALLSADHFAPVGGTNVPTQEQPKGGRKALVAGIVGGLATLAAVTVAFVVLGGDDTTETTDTTTSSTSSSTTTSSSSTTTTADVRLGTEIPVSELLEGDCVNFDNPADTRFEIVACSAQHTAEVTARPEHPEADGAYPGGRELTQWTTETCRTRSNDYLGVDLLETTLEETLLIPEPREWNEGLFQSTCLVGGVDDLVLVESIRGKGSSYPRPTDLVLNRLRPGDCFNPAGELTAFQLDSTDLVSLATCTEPHQGLFFGRGDLDYALGEPYPDADTLRDDSNDICDERFFRHFGVNDNGFNYRLWTPTEPRWNEGDRAVYCSLLDERGLRIGLDLTIFARMINLPLGSCFLFGPEETRDDLRIEDKVEPVDCARAHNGQIFGAGDLEGSGEFPGTDAVDLQVAELCVDLFVDYVGLSPFDSEHGDFTYWFPSEQGWDSGDFRWACALLSDETRVGTIEAANT